MNNQEAQKLVQSIHDSIFTALTEAPSGQKPVLPKDKTILILEKPGRTLNAADYRNPWSPGNLEGNVQAAINLGDLGDEAPFLPQNSGGVYRASGSRLSDFYRTVLSANIDPQPANPVSEKAYEEAKAVLFTKVKDEETGKETTKPSQLSRDYDDNFINYNIARSTYLTAYGEAIKTPEGKAGWPLKASALQAPVNVAYTTWRGGEATKVEDARSKIEFHSRNQVGRAFSDAKKVFDTYQSEAEEMLPGNRTLRCRLTPSNWSDPEAAKKWATISTSTKNIVIKSNSEFTRYGGNAGFSAGLFSIGGSAGHSDSREYFGVEANSLTVSFQYATVYLQRLWMNQLILSLPSWDLGAISAGFFSNGNKENNDGTIPLIPQGFIVTRNVRIQADWSKTDKETIKNATSGGGSFSFGPFSFGASGGSSSTTTNSKFDEASGLITIPGLQIVGWINSLLTVCPPNK